MIIIPISFSGVKLTDATGQEFLVFGNIDFPFDSKRPIGEVIPVDSKYPVPTKTGRANYFEGNLSGVVTDNNIACEDFKIGINTPKEFWFHIKFTKFLHNGLTKYMYLADDFIIPICIRDTVSQSLNNGIDFNGTEPQFGWFQVGDIIGYIENGLRLCPVCDYVNTLVATYCQNCATIMPELPISEFN